MIAARQIKDFFIGYKVIIYLKAHYCNVFESQEIVKNSQKNMQNNSLHIDDSDLYYSTNDVDGGRKDDRRIEKADRIFCFKYGV